jgi:hypothetical protein
MTQDLRKVSVELHGIDSFKKACRTAKALAEEYGFTYMELTEKDFRK